MKDFKHENVMSLTGITIFADIPAIVTPFMINGALIDYVAKDVDITVKNFFEFGLQIAKGMKYLADQNVVHRDLAARNILIDEHFNLKISDFGLTREYGMGDDSYQSKIAVAVPLAWMAIESFNGSYSTKSDVWSYGVVLWEIMARGLVPWAGVNTNDIPSLVRKGERLQSPSPIIPEEVYMLARRCWHSDPAARPSFSDLVKEIEAILRENPFEENPTYYSIQIPQTESQKAPMPLIPTMDYPRSNIVPLIQTGNNRRQQSFEANEMQMEMMPIGNNHNQNNHNFFANKYNPRMEASV